MLNRRTLRIKAMQTLFAYRQSQEANYSLGLDYIAEVFSPDLNSMEIQDKAQLKIDSKESKAVFKANFEDKDFSTSGDDKTQVVAQKAIKDYHKKNSDDWQHFLKLMVKEADKIVDQYLLVLLLLVEFATLAENDPKLNQERFVKNMLIQAIRFNSHLENIKLRKDLDWAKESNQVRQWFKELIKTDEKYNSYIREKKDSAADDLDIILHIIKQIVFKNEVIDLFMENNDLSWDENRFIIKSLVVKTIKSIPDYQGEDFELQELSYNWEDDRVFFIDLFNESIVNGDKYKSLIAEKTKNWDIERLAATDRIIIEMAIAEMINFPSIPVKVTINEYIEVAKRYSTPKSKVFINGILDVIANELEQKGVIKKSGRGLIDNK